MDYTVCMEHVTKTYGNTKILDDLTLHIQHGTIYGLLGRNGAGKTTLMKVLLSLTRADAGTVLFQNQPIGNGTAYLAGIGSLVESPCFYPHLTATKNLEIFGALHGISDSALIAETLELVGLPYRDKKPFSKYSMGMKQRLGLANAILHSPALLVLDEPANGLDPIGIMELSKLLRSLCREKGMTVLLSSHDLGQVQQVVDTVGILHGGKIAYTCSASELEGETLATLFEKTVGGGRIG